MTLRRFAPCCFDDVGFENRTQNFTISLHPHFPKGKRRKIPREIQLFRGLNKKDGRTLHFLFNATSTLF